MSLVYSSDYPIHLKLEELDHELSLRGIFGLGNQRTKTSALRGWLQKESTGLASPPKQSAAIVDAQTEIMTCNDIYDDIVRISDQALRDNNVLELSASFSRLQHVMLRLERIQPTSQEDVVLVAEILDCVYDAIPRITQEIESRQSKRATLNRNTQIQVQRLNTTNHPEIIDNNVSRQNIRLTSTSPIMAQTSLLEPNLSARESLCDLAMLREDEMADIISFNNSDHIQQMEISPNIINNNNITGTHITTTSQSVFQDMEKELDELVKEASGIHIDAGKNRSKVPTIERNQQHYEFPRNNPSLLTSARSRTNLSTIQPVQKSQWLSQPRTSLPQFNHQRISQPLLSQPAISQQHIHQSFLKQPLPAFSKRAVGLSNRRPYSNTSFSNQQLLSHQPFKSVNNVDDQQLPYRSMMNQHYFDNIEPSNGLNQNNYRHHNNESASMFRIPQHDRRTSRRSVPINQWRLSFSGDGKGTHLYDFISQVEAMQRSEGVSDNEMMFSVIHLLNSRARLWYQTMGDQYATWEELKTAMKREFLPDNYDYHLLGEINNRTQKNGESFGEYMTHMLVLFKSIAIPITNQYKLFVIQRNLLPKYAISVAPLEITTLDQLSNVCRRIDNATTNQRSLPYHFHRTIMMVILKDS